MELTHNLQDSIGTIDSEKGLQFPKLSISGQAYNKDQTRVGIGNQQFVVLDRFLSAATRDELLDQYRAFVAPKPFRKPKAETDEPA
jgi:hypothetical protein